MFKHILGFFRSPIEDHRKKAEFERVKDEAFQQELHRLIHVEGIGEDAALQGAQSYVERTFPVHWRQYDPWIHGQNHENQFGASIVQ